MGSSVLCCWTHEAIEAECAQPYGRYRAELDAHYRDYFAARPQLASDHPLKARDLATALPAGFDWLGEYLPERHRHRHYLSGRSSQTLALGLLGPAWRKEPTLEWLFSVLAVRPAPLTNPIPVAGFEREVDPALLNEKPRVTTVDFFAETPELVLCIEAKWGEAGLGRCSCPPGAPARAACAAKVLDRDAYWRTAEEVFGLPSRVEGRPCPISAPYQAIRNVAAARALAGQERTPVFALLYDERNPYFRRTGAWPGWPAALAESLDPVEELVRFRALPWQELAPSLPTERNVAIWAGEKHGLSVPEQ
jgi:hypothetical protein